MVDNWFIDELTGTEFDKFCKFIGKLAFMY
jgi:hypothetical protein